MEGPRKRSSGWFVIIGFLIVSSYVALILCPPEKVDSFIQTWVSRFVEVTAPASAVAPRGHIEQYKTVLLMYKTANGFYPSTEQGLKAVIAKPESKPKPRNWRMLMDRPILDPWNQEYFYEQPGKHNPNSYDLYSAGPDRKPGTADDIGNWDIPPD